MLNFNLFSKNITHNTPLIFLDIDGVFHAPFDQGRVGHAWVKEAILLLNKLIIETDAKVVISTYRSHYIGFHNVLADLGFSGLKADIIDYIHYPITGNNKESFTNEKNKRIHDYVFSNELTNYIIIDDYLLFESDYYSPLKDKFIKTNPKIGFNQSNYNQSIKLLTYV